MGKLHIPVLGVDQSDTIVFLVHQTRHCFFFLDAGVRVDCINSRFNISVGWILKHLHVGGYPVPALIANLGTEIILGHFDMSLLVKLLQLLAVICLYKMPAFFFVRNPDGNIFK